MWKLTTDGHLVNGASGMQVAAHRKLVLNPFNIGVTDGDESYNIGPIIGSICFNLDATRGPTTPTSTILSTSLSTKGINDTWEFVADGSGLGYIQCIPQPGWGVLTADVSTGVTRSGEMLALKAPTGLTNQKWRFCYT